MLCLRSTFLTLCWDFGCFRVNVWEMQSCLHSFHLCFLLHIYMICLLMQIVDSGTETPNTLELQDFNQFNNTSAANTHNRRDGVDTKVINLAETSLFNALWSFTLKGLDNKRAGLLGQMDYNTSLQLNPSHHVSVETILFSSCVVKLTKMFSDFARVLLICMSFLALCSSTISSQWSYLRQHNTIWRSFCHSLLFSI